MRVLKALTTVIVVAGIGLGPVCGEGLCAPPDHPAHNQNPMTFQISGPKTVVDHAAPVPGAIMAVRKAVINGIDGFVVEAKVPWKYFRDYKPKAGARLLFNLAANFSNQSGTATMGKAYWNGPSHSVQDLGIEAQIHPEHWGWLKLANSELTK